MNLEDINHMLPKFPLESIKALDDYLNEIVVNRSITSENLPVDIYYVLRNMSYNIIEILEVLDARACGLEQIKKEPTVHFLIRFAELGKWSLLISDGEEQEPILLHVPLKFIYFYFTSHVIRNKTKFDLPKNMDFVGEDYEIMSKIIGYTS